MKQRITYLRNEAHVFDQSQVQVTKDVININEVLGAKEFRITFGFSELPVEVLWKCARQLLHT